MTKSVPSLEVLCKPKGQYCHVTTLASEGDDLWVNGKFYLFHLEGSSLKEVRTKGDFAAWNEGLLVVDGALIACGDAGVVRSNDGGVTYKPLSLPEANLSIGGLALGRDGMVWAAGETFTGTGVVLYGKPSGMSLKRVEGNIGRATAIAPRREGGVWVGDWDGRVWVVSGDSAVATSLRGDARIRAICELASGTVLALVEREEVTGGQTLFRSVDGGKSFAEVATKTLSKEVFCTLRELPNGPLVVGAWGAVLISEDDGQTFVKVRHPGKADDQYTTSCLYQGKLLLGGMSQPIVAVSTGGKQAAKPAPKAAKKIAKERSSNGYVGSGKFKAALESLFGPLKKRTAAKQPDWLDEQLDLLPAKLAAEVHALYTLFAAHKVPPLCGLREGGFCTIPAQFDMDAEAVLEEEWFDDEDDVDFVMHALELFNDQGNPFIVVAKDGVYEFYDDPYEYSRIADDLTSFLQVLIALESAKRGKVSAVDARKLLSAKIHESGGKEKYQTYILRTLPEEAKPTKKLTTNSKAAPAAKKAAAKAGSKMFECTEGGASKFWEITLQGTSFTTRFGKIGTPGQSSTKSFSSADQAHAESEKLIREKTKKGYKPR